MGVYLPLIPRFPFLQFLPLSLLSLSLSLSLFLQSVVSLSFHYYSKCTNHPYYSLSQTRTITQSLFFSHSLLSAHISLYLSLYSYLSLTFFFTFLFTFLAGSGAGWISQGHNRPRSHAHTECELSVVYCIPPLPPPNW